MKNSALITLIFLLFFGLTQANNDFPKIFSNDYLTEKNIDEQYNTPPSINSAQFEKKTIAVWHFDGERQFKAKEVLHSVAMNAVVQSKRLKMVEKSKLDEVIATMNTHKMEETSRSAVYIEQGKLMGAQYCMFGAVNPLEIERKSRENSKTGKTTYYYSCTISMNLRIVDVETSEVIYAALVTESSTGDTKEEAWERSSKNISKDAKKFVKTAIPCQVNLADILDKKNGKAKKVLIEGGSYVGLEKGDHLRVFEMIPYGSGERQKFRKKKISNIVVTEVEGDDFSVCRVKNSGDDLLKKINSEATLICETYQPDISIPGLR